MEALHLPRSVPLRSPAPPPTALDVSIRRQGDVVELALAGDLDLATAHVLREAMTWLRFAQAPGQTIVIDTRSLDFVAVAGYRALRAAMVRADGTPDPGVACIVGPVVARFESALGAALAGGGGSRSA
jgi:anti-anti-sigma factor